MALNRQYTMNIPTLKYGIYQAWKFQMEILLKKENLWDLIASPPPLPK